MSARIHRSFRWRSTPNFDVDAFFLEEGDWFLFAYVKSASVAWESLRPELMSTFDRGTVRAVGGALKAKDSSIPLAPLPGAGAREVPAELWSHEEGLQFRLETGGALNPGFFLDQERNRLRLADLIRARKGVLAAPGAHRLLNLFSFTGAFSIVASCLGVETVSVDVSARYLEWEKKNHARNAPAKRAEWGGAYPAFRLVRADARDFIRRSLRKGETYSWIVLDPPTFSRSEEGVFQARLDLMPLLQDALRCLGPKGSLLVCTNDSRWAARDFLERVRELARAAGAAVEPGELPDEYGELDPPHPMKSAWLHRGASSRAETASTRA